eukprot:7162125-Alexandrium_andersonii.AAC.1
MRRRGSRRLKVKDGTSSPHEREFPHSVNAIPSILDGAGTPSVVHQRRTLVGKCPFRLITGDKQ